MPAILSPEGVNAWLDMRDVDAGRAAGLCRPAPEEWLDLAPASRRVNDVRNDGAELLRLDEDGPALPAPEPRSEAQGSLF